MTPKRWRLLTQISLVVLLPPVAILARDQGLGISTDGIMPSIGKAIMIALDLVLISTVAYALLRAWRRHREKGNSD